MSQNPSFIHYVLNHDVISHTFDTVHLHTYIYTRLIHLDPSSVPFSCTLEIGETFHIGKSQLPISHEGR